MGRAEEVLSNQGMYDEEGQAGLDKVFGDVGDMSSR